MQVRTFPKEFPQENKCCISGGCDGRCVPSHLSLGVPMSQEVGIVTQPAFGTAHREFPRGFSDRFCPHLKYQHK